MPNDRPSADSSTSAGIFPGADTARSIANCSPVNAFDRQTHGFQPQRRPLPPCHRKRIDRNPRLPRLPCRTRDAALVFLAVGNQRQPRQHAGGQGTDRLAHRRFQIRRAPVGARSQPQFPRLLVFRQDPPCESNAQMESRAAHCCRAHRPESEASFEARSRSRGETLADVSTNTPTATSLVEILKRGWASASRISVKVATFSASPNLRVVRRYSKYPQARGIQASSQHPCCGRKS